MSLSMMLSIMQAVLAIASHPSFPTAITALQQLVNDLQPEHKAVLASAVTQMTQPVAPIATS